MADIYLIYGRADEKIAEKLVELLKARWSIWWDRLVKQRFVEEIHEELPNARCALVLWSSTSRVKDTVVDEVKLAQDANIPMVFLSLDGSKAAYGFGGFPTIPIAEWDGDPNDPIFVRLFERLSANLPQASPPVRPPALAGGRVPLPTLFLSVSSFETQLVPEGAVKALTIAGVPAILVSAWDLVARRRPAPGPLLQALREYHENGGFILLDSGNYEASRLTNKRWNVEDLTKVLAIAPYDWAFGFDNTRKRSPRNPVKNAQIITEMALRDQSSSQKPILPVIHAPRMPDSGYLIEVIPEVTRLVAEQLRPPLIGIPERELGAGILQRIQTMQSVRRELDKLPFYQPVHLLGTGNPWTVAIMAAAGADTFDGLEWCRTVVDHQNDRLNHFQHFDLFTYQTGVADLMVAREALDDPGIDFAGKVAFHNIDYFLKFGERLREAVGTGGLGTFITGRLGKTAAEILQGSTKGLFR